MSEIRLSDFVNKRLKDIYTDEGEDRRLVLEFENNFKLIINGVGESKFLIKKERIEDSEDQADTKKRKPKKEKKK